MHRTRAFRLAVVFLFVGPLVSATSAGATAPRPLKSFASRDVTDYSVSRGQFDGTCPKSGDPRTEDFHQLFSARLSTHHGQELLGIEVCWENTGAEASDVVDTGKFELVVANGSFKGAVTGGWGDAPAEPLYQFTLTITRAVGTAAGWTGSHFVFWACGDSGTLAGLRLHPVNSSYRCPI